MIVYGRNDSLPNRLFGLGPYGLHSTDLCFSVKSEWYLFRLRDELKSLRSLETSQPPKKKKEGKKKISEDKGMFGLFNLDFWYLSLIYTLDVLILMSQHKIFCRQFEY